jgi:hypothetical protein
MWNGWSIYWLLWLVAGFGIPEGYALWTAQYQNTLSDQVWHLEGTGATFTRFFVAAFCLWLGLHFVFRWFT